MVDANTVFNTSGKFPTDADFWGTNVSDWLTADGITSGFSRVIAEQMFRPVNDPLTPMYNRFVGRPIASGKGWTERIVGKTKARKFKPKATAEDALGFYDSSGLEFNFAIDYEGWRPVSLPSELASLEQFMSPEGVGQLNSIFVDNNRADYQRDMESAIQMKAISTTSKEIELSEAQAESPQAILKVIQQTASAMRGTTTNYNDLTTEQNKLVYTNSDRILVFMGQDLFDDIMDSFSSLPSPDRIVRNAELIPMPDGLPTPLTTEQFNAGVVDDSTEPDTTLTTWTPSTKPVAVDKEKPLIWMCAANRIEVRPLVRSYKVNLAQNAAGDFVNEHMIWKCAIAVKPFENAVRINDYSA